MRQIKQNAFRVGRCIKDRAEKMAASPGNISDQFESGEVVAGEDGGNLTLRLGEHRCIEDVIRFFVLPKIVPQPIGKSPFRRALAASDGMLQFTVSVPVDR